MLGNTDGTEAPVAAIPKRRWRRLWPLLLAFGVPAALLVPAVHWSSEFALSVHTKAIHFKTAASVRNAGLFNSDDPLVLTVAGFDRLERDGANPLKNHGGQMSCTFENALLSSIDLSQPLQIALEVYDGALQMTLERDVESVLPLAVWETQAPAGKERSGLCAAGQTQWRAFSSNGRLQLTLRAIGKGKLPAEGRLDLGEKSSITFDSARGGPGIVGSGGELQLTEVDRKISLLDGQKVELLKVQKGTVTRIEPGPADLAVSLRASSADILREGVNEAATSAEYWTGQKPLVKYLSTVSLIGSTFLAFLNFLKLFKLEE